MTLNASKAWFYIHPGIVNKAVIIAGVMEPPQQHNNQQKPTIIGKQIKWHRLMPAHSYTVKKLHCLSDKKLQLQPNKLTVTQSPEKDDQIMFD